jgi:hypothetical protein
VFPGGALRRPRSLMPAVEKIVPTSYGQLGRQRGGGGRGPCPAAPLSGLPRPSMRCWLRAPSSLDLPPRPRPSCALPERRQPSS